MYIAELKGKMPGNLVGSEDILTSNVFSFFKYAERKVYLKSFFKYLDIDFNDKDLEAAEFLFWLTYTDGTEPDVVIIAGEYYILIEAKLGAGFDPGDKQRGAQLMREYFYGSVAALEAGKEFILVAITADYTYPEKKLETFVSTIIPGHFKWLNWQAVSGILAEILDSEERLLLPDREFALDLLRLMDKKKLRNFQSFSRLGYDWPPVDNVFFSAATAVYRGGFIGFDNALKDIHVIEPASRRIFYSTAFFNGLRGYTGIAQVPEDGCLFYKGKV